MVAAASQPATPVSFAIPPHACDSHTHIFGDPAVFALSPSRGYTPEPASVGEMRQLHRALHMERVVIVQPSIYGTDNSCALDAIKQLGRNARGIAVIDDKTSATDLEGLDRGGIRGIRINLGTSGITDAAVARERFQLAIGWIGSRPNWHIQMYTQLSVIEAIADRVAVAPMPVVFDHFGGAQAALGVKQPGFDTLVRLVKSGNAYVKISGAYRSSTQAPDYPDVAPLAQALIAANPQRILWGSDWPHPDSTARQPLEVQPLYKIDDGRVLNLLAKWATDARLRSTILVENPARLYGF
jgi:predicted TIM-barrel fold metal-dependent hydrolase